MATIVDLYRHKGQPQVSANAATTSGSESWSPTTSKVIEITLSLVGANNAVSDFTSRVAPRNL